ncbi:uncharacterized protein IUM83_09468 [Phytophthora cinnamomi]|uniref:uncharacterized protein n=1 Tax=Phytophthora cinnamomi TaxID=4785 RepID=UPI0035593BBC|nr:hypothetical protein IUM83_09468 [Phytophthora cinnamomi]
MGIVVAREPGLHMRRHLVNAWPHAIAFGRRPRGAGQSSKDEEFKTSKSCPKTRSDLATRRMKKVPSSDVFWRGGARD